ncbi:hypothetical protein CEXT_441291 [Caerostris extrusa]|uniref:Uncharacterized protein n=1 Tax=Caerostris extrusa TaxID=172846 RepID=A0AAV4XLM8_CAEEX|nr:hypothetical protein CEXT_441291 [Caerostris extrusa]
MPVLMFSPVLNDFEEPQRRFIHLDHKTSIKIKDGDFFPAKLSHITTNVTKSELMHMRGCYFLIFVSFLVFFIFFNVKWTLREKVKKEKSTLANKLSAKQLKKSALIWQQPEDCDTTKGISGDEDSSIVLSTMETGIYEELYTDASEKHRHKFYREILHIIASL